MKASVRMYRQGLGDCFLVRFPRNDGNGDFWVMIDCGVILGQVEREGASIQQVVDDIKTVTNGKVDLLVVTHEHWDHISGFIQAKETIEQILFKNVWLAWTENPNDAQAQSLAKDRSDALNALQLAESRLRLLGATDSADNVSSILQNYGVAGSSTTAAAMDEIRSLKSTFRYCDPSDPPQMLPGTNIRVFVLGPPRDEKLLRTLALSATNPEMYGLDATVLSTDASDAPFDVMQAIPTAVAKAMPFFQKHYWNSDVASDLSWRRIDAAFEGSAVDLALQLDSITNNTSLVLAFQSLPDGEVMLFPGDAQIGSWLSWQTLQWKVDNAAITGPDLLKKAVMYKVGHHGSHNATARQSGLEEMTSLRHAMIPVDHEEALKKRWDRMPLQELLDALTKVVGQNVIRVDDATGPGESPLYKELEL